MNGYITNIESETLTNENFRKVLYTGSHAQLVVMSLKVGEEIGMEVHPSVDQFFRIEQGSAKVTIDGEESTVEMNGVIIVPAGSQHNVVNASETEELKLYTIYSPPNHPAGTINVTKADAEAYEKASHN